MSIELYTTYQSHNGRTAIQPSASGQSRLEKPLNMSLHCLLFCIRIHGFPDDRRSVARNANHKAKNAPLLAGMDN
jgi:hypothetical protein